MRKAIVFLCLVVFGLFIIPELFVKAQIKKHIKEELYQEGDIIFQSSESRQCEAVKLATHSPYSHCGILFKEEGDWFVLEAIEPVQVTLLSTWIARGTDKHYVVKRLQDIYNTVSPEQLQNMKRLGQSFIGKPYDIYFNWSNEQIYCSELVWKIYSQAGAIEICAPKKLRDFDLNHPLVKEMMVERYGHQIPLDEAVVSPADLFESPKLITVFQDSFRKTSKKIKT